MSTNNTNNNNNNNNNKEWVEIKNGLWICILEESDDKPEDARSIHSGDSILLNLTGRQVLDQQQEGTSPVLLSHTNIDIDELDNFPIFQQAKGWLVTVGEPHCLLRAVEMGLEHMKEGQRALVYATPQHHWGTTASKGSRQHKVGPDQEPPQSTPATATVLYELHAQQIVMDTSRLNPYFTIQRTLTMKNIANDLYQYEWTIPQARQRAIRLYEKAAKAMHLLLGGTYFASVEPDHPQRKQCQTIHMDSLNNLIAVYLRAKQWSKAQQAAREALQHDAKNTKALLRNAKAYLLDPTMSLQDIDAALCKAEKVICYKDPEEKELQKLRQQWKKKSASASS